MLLNYIWIFFFAAGFLLALVRLVVWGEVGVMSDMTNAAMDAATNAFEISLGLTGVLALWMGVMTIGERGGAVGALARWLSPGLRRLFPSVPEGHPVMGQMFMNIAANMLGLDNAATPLGLKAMEGLQELNKRKDTASDDMIMFLVLNTSGLTLIPVSVIVYRAQMGAAQPTDVFIPILLATFASTLAGIVVTAWRQHINLADRRLGLMLGGACAAVGLLVWAFSRMDRETMNLVSSASAGIALMTIIVAFIGAGARKRINVYEAFVDGAKDGFSTAVRIIPYLVAILVAVAVFRASGAMELLMQGIEKGITTLGGDTQWVGALPTALMKPLSGSGARGLMVDAMQTYGPDSLAGRLSCIFQGSTDTTFYILAVYFGSVGIKRTRHAVACGLAADVAGLTAAVAVAYMFFG